MNKNVLYQLQAIFDSSSHNDTSRSIAKYILEHINSLDLLSINEVAENCFTSISTVSRFMKKIHLKSFVELKNRSEDYKLENETVVYDNLCELKFDLKNDKVILDKYIDTLTASLAEFKKSFQLSQVESLNRCIYEGKNIAVYGIHLSGLIAKHYQYLMFSIGKIIEYYDLSEDHLERAKSMTEKDIVIIFSVEGNYVASSKELIYILKKRGVHLVLITQNPNMNLKELFDETILLGANDSAKAGRYKLQLFSEILFNQYVASYKVL